MKLRDYQEQAVKRARLQFKNGSRVLFSLPTGGGKTIISHEIIRRAYEKNPELVSLFLTNRRVLAEQAKDTFVANGLRASLFMHGNALPDVLKSDEINETSEQVIVISYQTMLAALNKIEHPLVKECLGNGVPLLETIATQLPRHEAVGLLMQLKSILIFPSDVGIIIIDEAHMIISDNSAKVLRSLYPDTRVLGLTATPYNSQFSLANYFDAGLVEGVNLKTLQNDGYLIPDGKIQWVVPNNEVIAEAFMKSGDEFTAKDLDSLMKKAKLVGSIMPMFEKYAFNTDGTPRKTIIFCPSVAFAETIQQQITDFYAQNRLSLRSALVVARTEKDERDEIFENFKTEGGEIHSLVSVGVLTTGFDARIIETIINARATKSITLWLQMMGRGLRTQGEQTGYDEDLKIVDLTMSAHFHSYLPDTQWDDYFNGNPDVAKDELIESQIEKEVETKSCICKKCQASYPMARDVEDSFFSLPTVDGYKQCNCGELFIRNTDTNGILVDMLPDDLFRELVTGMVKRDHLVSNQSAKTIKKAKEFSQLFRNWHTTLGKLGLSLQSREWIIRYKFKNVKDIPSDIKGGEILDKQVIEGFATHFSIKAQHTKDSRNAKFYREIAREIREGLKNVAGN